MHLAPILLPALTDAAPASPAQNTFRAAVQAVESLRQQLHELRTAQTTARQRYWQQVGPAAAAVVTARRALYEPLENALLLGYFSRLEAEQIMGWIVANARDLQTRFGEDEAAVLARHGQRSIPGADDDSNGPDNDGRPAPAPPKPARPARLSKAERAAAGHKLFSGGADDWLPGSRNNSVSGGCVFGYIRKKQRQLRGHQAGQ